MATGEMTLRPSVELGLLPGVSPLEALERGIPARAIRECIVKAGKCGKLRRRLPPELIVALVIGFGLWARESVSGVLANLVEGRRERGGAPNWRPPAKSGLTQARQRLGPNVLRLLFRRLGYPLASPDTPGAFRFGLRLMAIDGATLSMPDSPANARAFGRPTTRDRAGHPVAGPWPLIRLVTLVECGTHLICDAVLRPFRASERPSAKALLRSVSAGMLVLLDQGLSGYPMQALIRARGADFLGRAPTSTRFPPAELLPDGSYLSYAYPSPRRGAIGLPVRVIEYVIDDPARPNQGAVYHLVTSLLDPDQAPADQLAQLYHERWEAESAYRELKVLQVDRRPAPILRSGNPAEVVQEVYGLLLAHIAIRRLMVEAAATAKLDPDRLSFTGALSVIRRAVPHFQRAADSQPPLCSSRTSWPRSPATGSRRAATAPSHG